MYRMRVATTPLRMLGAAFAAMAVNVVPLRYGGGTKVKMLDALMRGGDLIQGLTDQGTGGRDVDLGGE